MKRLSGEDRRFLQLVADATFTNPFSDEREAIDLRIIGRTGVVDRQQRAYILRDIVSSRIDKLEESGLGSLDGVVTEDRDVLRTCFLFEVYHRFHDDLDAHILDQVEAGDSPRPVPFAGAALELLRTRGFSAEEARRFFAVVFQVRRAFYFINRTLVGTSSCMKELRRNLWNSVFTHDIRWYDRYLINRMEDFSTLILGETGTGKGTAAAAIGRSGFIPFDEKRGQFVESFTRAFVSINLSQYPEMLIESALFGHRKGSFTGAFDDHEGVFSRCSSHGAIFLDEIGEVGVPIQIKLLQVLQERVFFPVGGQEGQRFNGRVIAATNRSIQELRELGRFRDDFFYRLCSHVITMPPLRERLRKDPGELDALLRVVLARMTAEDGEELENLVGMVAEIVRKKLPADFEWAGNVRELEQCVRRILLTRSYRPADRDSELTRGARLFRRIEEGELTAQELTAAYCAHLFRRFRTLAEVARRTGLDRRTVKKHIDSTRDG